MDGIVTKKTRVVSEQTKDKLRKNLAKARRARSERAAAVRQVKEANLDQIVELSKVFKEFLTKATTRTVDGSLKKDTCVLCERDYYPGYDGCPCRNGWAVIEKVDHYIASIDTKEAESDANG